MNETMLGLKKREKKISLQRINKGQQIMQCISAKQVCNSRTEHWGQCCPTNYLHNLS